MNFVLGSQQDAVGSRIQALVSEGAPGRIWRHDDTFWATDEACRRSVANRLGWLDVPAFMRERVSEIRQFAADVLAAGYRDAVLLGMGGSSLAPEVLWRSIGQHAPAAVRLTLHVLDTTDPVTIDAVAERIELARTLVIVSSKSGGTIEPNALFAYFYALIAEQKGAAAGENFIAITDPATSLEALAREHNFRRIFTNPADIGGRYSALSYFGLVPAALAGIDVARLLENSLAAEQDARSPQGDALTLGAMLGELALRGRDKCTFLASPDISSFGLWAEQLIAESTGKQGRGILPVEGEPVGAPRVYGNDRFFVQLRSRGGDNAANDAAVAALIAHDFPVTVIDLEDPYRLGGEFFRWEFAVALAGAVLDINPFDEPNVQESKDNTNRVLVRLQAEGVLDAPGVDDLTSPAVVGKHGVATTDVASAIADLFGEIQPGGYLGITAFIQQTPQSDALFAAMRVAVRDRTAIATTLGYGPRYLHSTGQLHKGGPPVGAFLQVTNTDVADISVPGSPYTFGQLKRAQAIGDVQSLAAHGRPVVRVHLGRDVDAGLRLLNDAMVAALAREHVRGR